MEKIKVVAVVLMLLCVNIATAAPVIMPSVSDQPFWCRVWYGQILCSLTTGGSGGIGPQGPAGPSGNNITNFFNLTTSNLSTVSNITNFFTYNFTYSEMNQTANMTPGPAGLPGPTGPQGIPGAANMTAGPQGETGLTGPMDANVFFTNATRIMTGLFNAGNLRITNVSAPTLANDTATKDYVDTGAGVWTAFTPSLTWTGGPPASVTATGKYSRIGKTVNFWMYMVSSDGNGATALTIALPTAANGSQPTNYYQSLTGYEYVNAVKTDPFARILYNAATPIITFSGFAAWTDNVQSQMWISGFYEVA